MTEELRVAQFAPGLAAGREGVSAKRIRRALQAP
jgi:hypothetical protein